MMNMMNKVTEELKSRIEAANFEPITITMKVNGDRITIIPCIYCPDESKSWDEVEYFLMDSCELNLYGGEKLSDVAKTICNYEKLLEEDRKALDDLKAHIRKYGEDSDWDFVSDYHKDIFGHRPHVSNTQVIAWAYSDSRGSARFYHL